MKPGLLDLLEKVSAPIEQLQAGLRRLNPIKAPITGRLGREMGAGVHVPTLRSTVPQSYMKGRGPENNKLGNNTVGQIFLPRGGSSQVLATKNPNFKGLSGDGKRAVNISVGLHEGFERGVKPQLAAPMQEGHAAPTVLINEHNMLSRMTGPGSGEARIAMRGMRQDSGEQNTLRKMFVDHYGDRASQYLEEGQKVPAAMRRNFAITNHNNAMANARSEWGPIFNEMPEGSAVPAEWQPYLKLHQRQKVAAQVNPQHEEFLDSHFSLSPQWKNFKKKLRSGTFLEAVRQDIRADDKLKRYSEANSRHLRARGVPTFSVSSQSSGKNYTVKYHADIDRFSCNCGDWVHARSHQTGKSQQDCKHIKYVKAQGNSESLTKQAAMGLAAASLLQKMPPPDGQSFW